MKLTIERQALQDALDSVRGAVERKNAIPILGNLLLDARHDKLAITGTDLDVVIKTSAVAEVTKPGRTTVGCDLLANIAKKAQSDAQIGMELEGSDILLVKTGRSRFRLQTLSADDFPSLGSKDAKASFTLPAEQLSHLFSKTEFAISEEVTRYYLNGTYLHIAPKTTQGQNDSHLRAVATDGHTLAQVEVEAPEGSDTLPGIIVPRKTVGLVTDLCKDHDNVAIEVSDTGITFAAGGTSITSKLIDGTFPDYGRVVPMNNNKLLSIGRAELASAIDLVATVSSEKARPVRLSMTEGLLTLSANDADVGNAVNEVEAEYTAEPLDIGFNSRYVREICSHIDADRIEVMFADPGSPTLFRPAGSTSDLYVVMPMRV